MRRQRLNTFLRKYGPAELITYDIGREMKKEGKNDYILTIHTGDTGTLYGRSGFHFVNRIEMYKLTNPCGEDAYVYDICFGDGISELPSP